MDRPAFLRDQGVITRREALSRARPGQAGEFSARMGIDHGSVTRAQHRLARRASGGGIAIAYLGNELLPP